MAARSIVSDVRGRRRTYLKALLLLASTAVCVLGAEAFLRVTDYVAGDLSLYRSNPAGGGSFRLKPNLDLVARFGETRVLVKTNSHGMRWREIPVNAGRPARRVAFVGDSFTFGLWADSVERSLVGVADSVLRPDGFEVMNFGVPGYGLLDVELQIQQEVLAFRPDYLIWVFYTGNDFLDTSLGLNRYRVSANGTLELDETILRRAIPPEFLDESWSVRTTLQTFRLYGLSRQVVKGIWGGRLGRDTGARIPATVTYTSNVFWSRDRYPEFADRAKNASLTALERIRARCEAQGIRLLVVALPSIEQVYAPSLFGEGYDIRLPQKYVEDYARMASIPYLDLLPSLAAQAREGKNLHFQSDGHFNNLGHQVTGELVAAFFERHAAR